MPVPPPHLQPLVAEHPGQRRFELVPAQAGPEPDHQVGHARLGQPQGEQARDERDGDADPRAGQHEERGRVVDQEQVGGPQHTITRRAAGALLLALALPMAACGTDAPPVVLLDEPFDDDANGWGGPFQSLRDGAYLWELPPGQSDARAADVLIAIERDLDDVAVDTVVTVQAMQSVGFDCAVAGNPGAHDFYDLALTRAGAVIRKATPGDARPVTLAESDAVTLTEGTGVALGARCRLADGVYQLALTVDGDTVVEATDPEPLGPGAPGLRAVAAPASDGGGPAQLRFDSFVVRVPADGPRLAG